MSERANINYDLFGKPIVEPVKKTPEELQALRKHFAREKRRADNTPEGRRAAREMAQRKTAHLALFSERTVISEPVYNEEVIDVRPPIYEPPKEPSPQVHGPLVEADSTPDYYRPGSENTLTPEEKIDNKQALAAVMAEQSERQRASGR